MKPRPYPYLVRPPSELSSDPHPRDQVITREHVVEMERALKKWSDCIEDWTGRSHIYQDLVLYKEEDAMTECEKLPVVMHIVGLLI